MNINYFFSHKFVNSKILVKVVKQTILNLSKKFGDKKLINKIEEKKLNP